MDTTDARATTQLYKYYDYRLATFKSWPLQMQPDKYALARYGFVYTGAGDKVKCYKCGIGIMDWERTDNPWREHLKWSPRCDFLRRIGETNYDKPDVPNVQIYTVMKNFVVWRHKNKK